MKFYYSANSDDRPYETRFRNPAGPDELLNLSLNSVDCCSLLSARANHFDLLFVTVAGIHGLNELAVYRLERADKPIPFGQSVFENFDFFRQCLDALTKLILNAGCE
jgi:hypothetical protein